MVPRDLLGLLQCLTIRLWSVPSEPSVTCCSGIGDSACRWALDSPVPPPTPGHCLLIPLLATNTTWPMRSMFLPEYFLAWGWSVTAHSLPVLPFWCAPLSTSSLKCSLCHIEEFLGLGSCLVIFSESHFLHSSTLQVIPPFCSEIINAGCMLEGFKHCLESKDALPQHSN